MWSHPQWYLPGNSDRKLATIFYTVPIFIPPAVHYNLFGLVGVWVAFPAPPSQPLHRTPGGLISFRYKPAQSYVVHEFNNDIAGVEWAAVMFVQGEEQGAQHTALWGAGAETELRKMSLNGLMKEHSKL